MVHTEHTLTLSLCEAHKVFGLSSKQSAGIEVEVASSGTSMLAEMCCKISMFRRVMCKHVKMCKSQLNRLRVLQLIKGCKGFGWAHLSPSTAV